MATGERISDSRAAKGERGIWQRRYWEQTIRDENDFARHIDYIHINPVKHGLVARVSDWPYSSFHRMVKLGIYPEDVLACLHAMRTRRPVKWVEDRIEFFRASTHGRESVHKVRIGARSDGQITGMSDAYAVDCGGDFAERCHQLLELCGIERLLAIGHGFFGPWMDLDDDTRHVVQTGTLEEYRNNQLKFGEDAPKPDETLYRNPPYDYSKEPK